MWQTGNNRSLQPVTVAMLDFLASHPYATKALIQQKLGFTSQQVQSTYYHYGFTGSDKAKKKYPDLWAIGEKIRQKWPSKPAQANLPLKEVKAVKPAKWKAKASPAVWPDEDPVNQIQRVYAELEKKQQAENKPAEPTVGQAVLRQLIAQDDHQIANLNQIAKLTKEVERLQIIIDYLRTQQYGNAI
jgi:hypothetical protein